MEKFNGYEETSVITEQERLPVGGYELFIMDAKEVKYDWGNVLLIRFDIATGEYSGFFSKNYSEQTGEDKKWKGTYRLNVPKGDGTEKDNWAARRFKTVISNIEDSNPGYHWNWDEKTLKGKRIGGIFNNKEYDFEGRHGFYTNCHSLVPVEKIRSGNYTIPEDTLINKNTGAAPTPSSVGDGFMNIPEGIADEVPFN